MIMLNFCFLATPTTRPATPAVPLPLSSPAAHQLVTGHLIGATAVQSLLLAVVGGVA